MTSKNHRKIGHARKAPVAQVRVRVLGALDPRFKEARLALAKTTTIPKASARLARELLTFIAERCPAGHLSDQDVIAGSMWTALLTATSIGMTREEFSARLRLYASVIERNTAPASSGTQH